MVHSQLWANNEVDYDKSINDSMHGLAEKCMTHDRYTINVVSLSHAMASVFVSLGKILNLSVVENVTIYVLMGCALGWLYIVLGEAKWLWRFPEQGNNNNDKQQCFDLM